MSSSRSSVMRLACGTAGFAAAAAVLVLVWTVAAAQLPAFLMPSLPATLARLNRGDIWPEAIAGAATLLVSFLRALTYALPIAVVVGLTPIGFAVFFPVLRFLAMLPVVAVLPLAVLWFGFSMTQEGVHGPSMLAMMAVIGAGVAAVVHKAHDSPALVVSFEFPSGAGIRDALRRELPGMFRTFRRAVEIGAVTLIAHQYIVGKSGIGFLILNGVMVFEPAQVMAAIIAAWVMVIVLELLLFAVEFVMRALIPASEFAPSD